MEPPLHICHIITRFIRGGADENTLLTCNGQVAAGHKVTLICGTDYDTSIRDELDASINFISVPSLVRSISPLNEIKAYRFLLQWCRAHKPDIVHTHESKAGILGRFAAAQAKVPTIIHGVHILAFMGASAPVALIYTILEKLAGRVTDAFIHVSPAMQEACNTRNIGSNAHHIIIPSGMVLARYKEAAPVNPASHPDWHGNMPDNPHILIMSGTLEPRKRVAEFLPALRLICDAVPHAVLVVAGDGSQRSHIEAEITRLNLNNNVLLLGYSTELPAWIAASTLGVHAAEHEGLPRVIMQYIAAGKPVVACALDGLNTIITDRNNGIIVPAPDAMAQPIITLLTDEEALQRYTDAAQITDVMPWSHETMVRDIAAVYRHVRQAA